MPSSSPRFKWPCPLLFSLLRAIPLSWQNKPPKPQRGLHNGTHIPLLWQNSKVQPPLIHLIALQSSPSSETTLTPYLDNLVKRLDMSQTLIGNALAPAPEGDEGAGAPATPERSTTPDSAANGADPHEGARATSPFATLSDVFTIGSSPTASESSIETTIFFGRSSSPGPADGSMRSLTATITRDYGTNPPVANHSTESDITNSNEGSEVDLGSGRSDNSEAPSHTEIILFIVVWTIAAFAVMIAAVAVVVAFTATVRMQRKQNGSSVTAILSEKRVSQISAFWSQGN